MKSIYQKAKDYSSKKFELAMSKAIAQAYLDGFKDGYKARKDKEESGFIDDIDFVDLGLPSGTLWASDSLRDDEELCLLTFDEANMLDIPSEEQCEELVDHCSCRFVNNANGTIGVDFVGPNDQTIHFSFYEPYVKPNGWKEGHTDGGEFWLKNVFDSTDDEGAVAYFYKLNGHISLTIKKRSRSADFRLPVRLIKGAI